MTTKLNLIKSTLRESIEMASKATEGPWEEGYDNDTGKNDDSFWEWWEAGPARCEGVKGEANATFIAHARTMTPIACKALLTAIEGLEQTLFGIGNTDDRMSDENSFIVNGIGDLIEKTLNSIASEWPDV